MQRTGDSRTCQILSSRTIKRLASVMCGLHHVRGNEKRGVFWFSLKTKVNGLSVVWPQNLWDGFSSVYVSKPIAMVCE
jgi:hypothetical protein